MTNTEIIQAIKAEIERLAKRADRRTDKDHASHNAEMERYGEDYWNGYGDLAYALLSFLSALESEKPIDGLDVTDFCKPIDPGIAQCIADHSWEMLGEDEKPVPNDLEEAAMNYIAPIENEDGLKVINFSGQDIKDAFIDGAKWQKEHDAELIEIAYNDGITIGMTKQKEQDLAEMVQSKSPLSVAYANRCFENGKQAMKEQMLKEAEEADVNIYRDLAAGKSWAEFVVEKPPKNLGDKVRIIIVKEDEQ